VELHRLALDRDLRCQRRRSFSLFPFQRMGLREPAIIIIILNLHTFRWWCSLNNISSCHSEPASLAGEESALAGQKQIPSRDKTALRNDNLFKLHHYPRLLQMINKDQEFLPDNLSAGICRPGICQATPAGD
jgi:hypothetical protein